jgi:NADH:ubiquinone reductase (non-electrogenic)
VRIRSEIPNEVGEYEDFLAPYDILVYGCGAQSGTFGTPGVREHAFFLKEISDAVKLRQALVDRFERANMPSVSMEEKKRILSFVVVGGGPTGVEFSGEFSDFLNRDLAKVGETNQNK